MVFEYVERHTREARETGGRGQICHKIRSCEAVISACLKVLSMDLRPLKSNKLASMDWAFQP